MLQQLHTLNINADINELGNYVLQGSCKKFINSFSPSQFINMYLLLIVPIISMHLRTAHTVVPIHQDHSPNRLFGYEDKAVHLYPTNYQWEKQNYHNIFTRRL